MQFSNTRQPQYVNVVSPLVQITPHFSLQTISLIQFYHENLLKLSLSWVIYTRKLHSLVVHFSILNWTFHVPFYKAIMWIYFNLFLFLGLLPPHYLYSIWLTVVEIQMHIRVYTMYHIHSIHYTSFYLYTPYEESLTLFYFLLKKICSFRTPFHWKYLK